MSTTLDFNANLAQQIEAIYATPDVAARRIAVFSAAAPRSAEKVLDVGCGPGYLTRDLALSVGPQGQVTGLDISEPMLGLAANRCAGLSQVHLAHADARKLPADDATLDLACALQVYCYVTELDEALADLHRAIKPGGRVVVLDSDFSGVVWESHDRERMRRVLEAYDAHVAWPDLPRVLPHYLR